MLYQYRNTFSVIQCIMKMIFLLIIIIATINTLEITVNENKVTDIQRYVTDVSDVL